ncbi:MAG TPA: helix-turn-helix domain-containing protein [Opitutaceae bacterium]|nr:helix-turn-helix domain-containing protein [Opitutaceae bacterium]
MPFIDKLNQLEAARVKLAEMESSLTAERTSALANLPSEFGYPDLNSFIRALKSAQRSRGGRRKGAKKAATGKAGRRTRAKITDETRNQVRSMVQAGKTGNEIAASLKISLPTVQNIKKALGLVKARGAAAS